MSDIKNKLIKIAYENPGLRAELLPVINSMGMSHEAGAINNFFRGITGRPSEPKVQEEIRNFKSGFTSDFQKKLKTLSTCIRDMDVEHSRLQHAPDLKSITDLNEVDGVKHHIKMAYNQAMGITADLKRDFGTYYNAFQGIKSKMKDWNSETLNSCIEKLNNILPSGTGVLPDWQVFCNQGSRVLHTYGNTIASSDFYKENIEKLYLMQMCSDLKNILEQLRKSYLQLEKV